MSLCKSIVLKKKLSRSFKHLILIYWQNIYSWRWCYLVLSNMHNYRAVFSKHSDLFIWRGCCWSTLARWWGRCFWYGWHVWLCVALWCITIRWILLFVDINAKMMQTNANQANQCKKYGKNGYSKNKIPITLLGIFIILKQII